MVMFVGVQDQHLETVANELIKRSQSLVLYRKQYMAKRRVERSRVIRVG